MMTAATAEVVIVVVGGKDSGKDKQTDNFENRGSRAGAGVALGLGEG